MGCCNSSKIVKDDNKRCLIKKEITNYKEKLLKSHPYDMGIILQMKELKDEHKLEFRDISSYDGGYYIGEYSKCDNTRHGRGRYVWTKGEYSGQSATGYFTNNDINIDLTWDLDPFNEHDFNKIMEDHSELMSEIMKLPSLEDGIEKIWRNKCNLSEGFYIGEWRKDKRIKHGRGAIVSDTGPPEIGYFINENLQEDPFKLNEQNENYEYDHLKFCLQINYDEESKLNFTENKDKLKNELLYTI